MKKDTLVFPLSFAQERLWFIEQFEPGTALYNVFRAFRLKGQLNVNALHRSLDEIVRRHEVLRTSFSAIDGQPVQVIARALAVPLSFVDLSERLGSGRDEELLRLVNEECRRPFDLARSPLLRATLLRLGNEHHVLLLMTHHIVCDGWSLGILCRELSVLYDAFLNGRSSPLGELPIQYVDFAQWQRQSLLENVLEGQLSYWKNQLRDYEILQLPTDRPRPAIQSRQGATHDFFLSADIANRLKTLSQREKVSLFMTLLAAFKTLIHRHTTQRDVLVGVPVAGRDRLELENLIGLFVNTLALRTEISGDLTFRQLLQRVRDVALEAYSHQDVPFEKVVEALQPQRDLSRNPLVQLMFQLRNLPAGELAMSGLEIQPVRVDIGLAKFDLALEIEEQPAGVLCRVEYTTDLFDEATVVRMMDHLRILLQGIVANPDQHISNLPVLTAAERRRLLVEWNDTKTDYPKDKCIHELFEEQVEKTPGAVAVVFEEQELSYRELNLRANQLANYLHTLGVEPETLVGICVERSLEMIVGLLGILKAGGAYVPLDPEYPNERLGFMLEDTRAPIVLTQRKLAGQLAELTTDGRPMSGAPSAESMAQGAATNTTDGGQVTIPQSSVSERAQRSALSATRFPRSPVLGLRSSSVPQRSAVCGRPSVSVVRLDTDWDIIAQESDENPISSTTADHLAYVMYTSGSTGQPKGVEVTHRGISRLVRSGQYVDFNDHQTFLHLASISFDASTFEIWGALLHGSRCVVFPGKMPRSDELGDLLRCYAITTLWLTASLFNAVVAEAPQALAPVRELLIGGEVLSVPHVRRALAALRETQIINGYGPTENTTFTCCYPISRELDDSTDSIPLGRPIANTEVYLLDAQLSPVPIGVTGELYIGGDGLARGYLNRPELTAEKFIPNPFSAEPGARLYKTGDLARYLVDGNIEFVGRLDGQVKIRGFRVELGEIESVLSRHPAVKETVVVARDDIENPQLESLNPKSETCAEPSRSISNPKSKIQNPKSDKRLVAYVVPRQSPAPAVSEVRSFLKAKLPEYMIPSAFVFLDILPLTSNGKIDRRGLPVPDQRRPELEEVYVASRTPVEEMIAEIWAEVLKLDTVGVHDNFFQLGGHSLTATQVMSRVRASFKVELPLRALFERPTVAELAERVEEARGAEKTLSPPGEGISDPTPEQQALSPLRLRRNALSRATRELPVPAIQPVSRDQELPLSFSQQRLWFLDQLDPGNPTYNIPVAFRLTGSLHVAALERSLNEIVRRHESLRTSFSVLDGHPIQIIAPSLTVALPVVDLQELSETEREARVRQLTVDESRHRFDLAHAPLVRWTLLRLGSEDHVLLVSMHHIVSDGWSMGVFFRELSVLYQAFYAGKPSPLPELAIQYADFTLWQRQWLQGQVIEPQLSYWRQQLETAPPVLELPTDYPRPPVQTYRGASQSLVLSKTLTEALKVLSRQESSTLFMALLAAFQILLHRYTGQDDIVVGTPVAGRNRIETEGLIGLFVNTLVLRCSFSDDPTFRELLATVHEMALGAYSHQDVPFEKLVEELKPERSLSYSPLFQVMFVLENAPSTAFTLEGLRVSRVLVNGETAKFDLTAALQESINGLTVWLGYSTDLFEDGTITRLLGHLQILLESIVANPDQRVGQLPILGGTEKRRFLIEWNDTKTDYPKDKCVHELFEEQVEKTPGAVAVVFEEQELSYRELNLRANQLANYLRMLGVEPETLVGICVERSLEMIVGLLGILKAGSAYVPLDPEYPNERLAFMLEDTRAPVLLTQSKLLYQKTADQEPWAAAREKTQSIADHQSVLGSQGASSASLFEPCSVPGLRSVVCLDTDWGAIAQQSEGNPFSRPEVDNLAYVIYTSGSTGTPKGVMVSHRSISAHCSDVARVYELNDKDHVLQFASPTFDASLEQILPTLISGGRVVLRGWEVPSPLAFHRAVHDSELSVINLPSAYWHQLARTVDRQPDRGSSRLRLVVVGGDEMLAHPVKLWHGTAYGKVRLLNAYGPTEATITSMVFEVSPDFASELGSGTVAIGRPFGGRQLFVLDRDGNLAPIGVIGELYIAGVPVARGYLNRPELTAERFIPNPFSDDPGVRMYKTGDLVRYRSDGNIEFHGRVDHQVKVRGFRIEPGEIEAVLSQHPAVKETVVLARDEMDDPRLARENPQSEKTHSDPTGGNQSPKLDKRLVAYIVAVPETAHSVDGLRDFLRHKLPEYMLPSVFVFLDALPLTSTGKIDRKALPAPDQTRPELRQEFVAARTPLEEIITEIWTDVLKLDRVGIHDNFFDLGGHSLLATQAISRMRNAFRIDLPLRNLFERPTVAGLAEHIETLLWVGQKHRPGSADRLKEREQVSL